MRILFAVADALVSRRVEGWLSDRGIVADIVDSSDRCADQAGLMAYDMVIYDLNLEDGVEGLRAFRQAGHRTPVLALEGQGIAAARTRALDLGADDCMSRPLDQAELLARVTALVRRGHAMATSLITIGDLEIDLRARAVLVKGQVLRLSRRHYSLLEILALRKGHIVDRDTIRNHIYGPLDWCESRTIDVFVHFLRRAIAEAGGNPDCLQTLRSLGFRLGDVDATFLRAA